MKLTHFLLGASIVLGSTLSAGIGCCRASKDNAETAQKPSSNTFIPEKTCPHCDCVAENDCGCLSGDGCAYCDSPENAEESCCGSCCSAE